jgi:hypothetical protein
MSFPNGRSSTLSMMSEPLLAVAWSVLIFLLQKFYVAFDINTASGGRLKFKIHLALSFYNLMKVAEYIYSVRTGGLRGRGVYILHADGKC